MARPLGILGRDGVSAEALAKEEALAKSGPRAPYNATSLQRFRRLTQAPYNATSLQTN